MNLQNIVNFLTSFKGISDIIDFALRTRHSEYALVVQTLKQTHLICKHIIHLNYK